MLSLTDCIKCQSSPATYHHSRFYLGQRDFYHKGSASLSNRDIWTHGEHCARAHPEQFHLERLSPAICFSFVYMPFLARLCVGGQSQAKFILGTNFILHSHKLLSAMYRAGNFFLTRPTPWLSRLFCNAKIVCKWHGISPSPQYPFGWVMVLTPGPCTHDTHPQMVHSLFFKTDANAFLIWAPKGPFVYLLHLQKRFLDSSHNMWETFIFPPQMF